MSTPQDFDEIQICKVDVEQLNPEEPQVYRRGEVAEAEPAVPGWTMLVDNFFV